MAAAGMRRERRLLLWLSHRAYDTQFTSPDRGNGKSAWRK
jgi:hypothetical protein